MGLNPVKIIQISDIHLTEDPEAELLGVPTDKSFMAVVRLLQEEREAIDIIVLTGDISQDGTTTAYKRVAERLAIFNVPVYWIPGNHDDNGVLANIFPMFHMSNEKHIILKNWQLILLNSQIPEQVEGNLDATQMDFLNRSLQKYPEHQALIFCHHHPVKVGSKWLDQLGLQNADEFWKNIRQYHHIHSVIFGHVHQEYHQTVNGINCMSAPSTCIQFYRHRDDFALENLNPGYRWLHLFDDGHIDTGVKRTHEYIGEFQNDARGY